MVSKVDNIELMKSKICMNAKKKYWFGVIQCQKVHQECPSTTKWAKCAEKNEELLQSVKDIVSELQTKHRNACSPEQFNEWAHLIDIKKHQSFDEPPNNPFFQGRKNTSSQANFVQPETSHSSPSSRLMLVESCLIS